MGDSETTFGFLKESNSWVPMDQFPIPNRGINFGDGLFETMVIDQGKIRFVEAHQQRLLEGLKVLGMRQEEVDFDKLVEFLRARFWDQTLRVRWTIFRSGLGRYTPTENSVEQLIYVEPFHPAPLVKSKVGISKAVHLTPTSWSHCKTLNALPYVLAGLERQKMGWDEIILLDHLGRVSEAGASSIFWEKDGQFFTPSLSCGCVAGVSRAVILQKFALLGMPIFEGEYELQALLSAERVWTSNVTGISYLESLESSKFSIETLPLLKEIFD
jgi:branched-subunit amino acid aminotransferase/4-amino-4-deoxychorismate lyase